MHYGCHRSCWNTTELLVMSLLIPLKKLLSPLLTYHHAIDGQAHRIR